MRLNELLRKIRSGLETIRLRTADMIVTDRRTYVRVQDGLQMVPGGWEPCMVWIAFASYPS